MARTTGFQITVQMKVAPSHEVIHYAYLYTRAKQLIVNWLVETKPSFKNEKELLSIIHHEWYDKLKQIGLPSRLAEDCYRDAGNVYLSWLENPNERKSKRFPTHGTFRYFSTLLIPWVGLALGVVSLASTTPHGAQSRLTP